MLSTKAGDRPILLLDEVAAELDNKRREILLSLLKGQVFYASTHMPQFTKINQQRQCKTFEMKRGEVEVSKTN